MEQINKITLLRQKMSNQGTEGILNILHLDVQYFTLELPWRDNKTKMSCIPKGTYSCKLRYSNKRKYHYWVTKVKGRSYILIHSGNFAGDVSKGLKTHVQGCILLGKKRGILAGQRAVFSSKQAVKRFMDLMQNKEFTLEVV